MKSRINTLVDYHGAPFEREVTVSCPPEYVQSQMRHLTRSYKKTESVETLEKGDVAVLSLESGLEKFNKPSVFVTVGGGLFHKEFEERLVGHVVGETFETEVDGQPVKVKVKQASRTIFPEPTDEMAKAYAKEHEDFADVTTVKEYQEQVVREYLEDQKKKVIYETLDEVLEYVLTHSDFAFDEEEIRERMERSKAEMNEELKNKGKSLETLEVSELRMYFGVETLEEFEKLHKSQIEWEIASDLWLMQVHGKESVEEIEEYPWEFLEKFVRENVKITEEA